MSVNATHILDLLRWRPFDPLRIHMTDGAVYDIPHPEVCLVLRRRLAIAVPVDAGLPDRLDYCSLGHVVRVEVLHSEPSS